ADQGPGSVAVRAEGVEREGQKKVRNRDCHDGHDPIRSNVLQHAASGGSRSRRSLLACTPRRPFGSFSPTCLRRPPRTERDSATSRGELAGSGERPARSNPPPPATGRRIMPNQHECHRAAAARLAPPATTWPSLAILST